MNAEREDIYARVTNEIIKAIEAGTKSHRLPWHVSEADSFAPMNAVSKRPYRGVNVLILWIAAVARGYDSGFWATYRQWQELGAYVRKGEKATTVVLWKPTEQKGMAREEDAAEERKIRGLLAKGFSVFNASQVEGYQPPVRPKLSESDRVRAAEEILCGVGAEIRHGGGIAYYDIDNDRVHLPPFESFRSPCSYYSTLAHELTHWTGAQTRLARDLGSRFGSAAYALEELVAQLGAAFLSARFGLSTESRPQDADYIANWLSVLRNDKKALFTAASKAQQAVDWILLRAESKHGNSESAQAA